MEHMEHMERVQSVNGAIETIVRALPLVDGDVSMRMRLKQQLGMLLAEQARLLGLQRQETDAKGPT